jgi:DNA-binding transcriptional MerR regulator
MEIRPPLWTLDELCAQAALALATDYPGQASGRVREVPDRRLVRYYTTLGLLDRPVTLRGRTALYSRRHLLQLVAIKRLQVTGSTLLEIQTSLLGQQDAALESIARLPEAAADSLEGTPDKLEEGTAAAAANEEPRRDAFWKREPSPVTPPRPAETETLLAVPLADGVRLLLHAERALDEHDVEALRSAAAPLLHLLRKRRLIGDTRNSKREESR